MPWFFQEKGKTPPDPNVLSPMRRFQLREAAFERILVSGEQIDYQTWQTLDQPDITIIGNSSLRPDQFLLRPADYQAIGALILPGKSAMFDFMDISTNGGRTTKEAREVFIQLSFGKRADRRDNLYHASVPNINSCGFEVFYAPVKTNGLHVRLVYRDHLNLNYPVMDTLPEIPESAREVLASTWQKATIT